MKSAFRKHKIDLDAALEQFEASIETPFVPGELERWMNGVNTSFQAVAPLLDKQITDLHPQEFAEISGEDLGLSQRVEQMQQEDAEIRQAAAGLARRIPNLSWAVNRIEPDEAKLQESLETFVKDTLQFIIRVRTQEQAIRTWLMEAYDRDRGEGD